jgi:hypothetical protein
MDENLAATHQAVKKSVAEMVLKVINYALLIILAIMGLGLIGFYYGLYDVKPYEQAILIAWVVFILLLAAFKEIKVKPLGKRVSLNIALYIGLFAGNIYLFFVW